MFPASTTMGGMCLAFPDVCLVPAPPAPPIPTPFPNIAQCAMANPGTCTTKVKIMNMPVIHKDTQIPISNGDEPGVNGGVTSGTFIQKAVFMSTSTKVAVEGKKVVMFLAQTMQNNNNAAGAQIAPSQGMVIIGG